MKLNFAKTPVSREAIDRAIAKRQAEAEEVRALAFAADEEACQKVVNAGRKRLSELRKAAKDFAKRFKTLKGIEDPVTFVQTMRDNSLVYELGNVSLQADYCDDEDSDLDDE